LVVDERRRVVGGLVDEANDEIGLEAVAALVDPGAVHREDQAGVPILLRHRHDRGAVEGEVETDGDVEEVGRAPLGVEPGASLPDEPAVVVPARDDEQRAERLRSRGPRTRDLPGDLAVLGLKHDVPITTCVANEHAPLGPGIAKRPTFLIYCGTLTDRPGEHKSPRRSPPATPS